MDYLNADWLPHFPFRNILLTNAVSLEGIYRFGAVLIDTVRIQSKVDWAWQLLQPGAHKLLEKTYVPGGLNLHLTKLGFDLNVRGGVCTNVSEVFHHGLVHQLKVQSLTAQWDSMIPTVTTPYDGDHDSFVDIVKFALFAFSVRRTQQKRSWKSEIAQFMKDLKSDLLKVLSDTITDFIHEFKRSNDCYNRRVPSRVLRRYILMMLLCENSNLTHNTQLDLT